MVCGDLEGLVLTLGFCVWMVYWLCLALWLMVCGIFTKVISGSCYI